MIITSYDLNLDSAERYELLTITTELIQVYYIPSYVIYLITMFVGWHVICMKPELLI